MQRVMDEVSITVFLFNDIVSLKKEVVDGQVDSTVSIFVWSQNMSPQAAVDKAVKMLEVSWENLLAAGTRLQDVADTEPCLEVNLHHLEWTRSFAEIRIADDDTRKLLVCS